MTEERKKYLNYAKFRYETDVPFKTLVDMIEHLVFQGTYTPSELRMAIMLATTNSAMRRTDIAWTVDENGIETVILEDVGNVKKVC